MLQIKDYKKQFANHLIVGIPSLELPHNIYWLKGENGSGKTTLIKSIGGLIPFEGSIKVNGTDIHQNRMEYRRIVNYAEAEPLYPGFLTGNDLISFYAKTKGATDEQVQNIMAATGIEKYAGSKIGTYSSGMAKKLSLSLGFLGNPKLILLDEPLITLDVESVAILQKLIEEYYNQGVSFLITSHQEIHFPTLSPSRLIVKDKTISII